jgi:MipA family protein
MLRIARTAFRRSLGVLIALCAICTASSAQDNASVTIRLSSPPEGGELRVLLYDSAVTFGRFSDEARVVRFPADGSQSFTVADVPPGLLAVVVHHDLDANGEFDKNFIGIPREPIAISRNYQPKGPPVFANANFILSTGEERVEELELYQVLGKYGLFGVGLGVIGRSSPYPNSDAGVFQPIPAITFNGSKLQWFGPSLRYGLVGSDSLRLAATASYRLRAYEEDDSPALAGMGDRSDTLMAGLAVISELPAGFNLSLGYEHDVLGQIGGGSAQLRASRSFQWGITRFNPQLGLNWTSADLANHDYGVSTSEAAAGRPAYDVGDALSLEVGVGSFIELSREWRIVFDVGVEFLPDSGTNSPIVSEDTVVKGFFALTYVI